MSSMFSELAAGAAFFVVADFVYTLDHYLVHHDRERYRRQHGRHHARYVGEKNAPQLDGYELGAYSRAAAISFAGMLPLSMLTGNWGFAAGAVLKYAHSLLFHLYQHGWWREGTTLKRQRLPPPARTWGFASARYHAHHHAEPGDAIFTYAETWAGFDRILEWAHPWLVKYTVDGRARLEQAQGMHVHAPVPSQGMLRASRTDRE